MKKLILLSFLLAIVLSSMGQVTTDTLYYDKDWKGVGDKTFATYVRITLTSADSNFRNQFKDYYITGELHAEGGFVSIGKYDDAESVFDGECTEYSKDGMLLRQATYNNGVLNGTLTICSEDGNVCTQTDLENGQPKYDYCILSNRDGLASKVKLSDNQPIYESITVADRMTEYNDGNEWQYYEKNGMVIAMANKTVKDYGKYFELSITISNKSMYPIDIDPNNINAILIDKNKGKQALRILSSDEYMKKVNRSQKWKMLENAYNENQAAVNAGKSTSSTKTDTETKTSSYASGNAFGSSGTTTAKASSSSTSNTTTTSTTNSYNGSAAYQAQVVANDRIDAYNEKMMAERAEKEEEYLKRTTLYPGDTLSRYLKIEQKKGDSMTINIDINGITYTFDWAVTQ